MAFITTGKLISVISADRSNDYIEISRYNRTADTYESYKMSVGNLLSSIQQTNNVVIDDSFSGYGLQSDYVDLISEQSITGNKKFYTMESDQASFGAVKASDIDTKSLVVRETALFQNNLTCNGNMYGLAMSACWADLAEYYESDESYAPGTLVQFGGEKQVTVATASSDAAAVVTHQPGFILNSALSSLHRVALALVGKTPIRVIGKIDKFDKVVISNTPGVGRKMEAGDNGNVIGVALAAKSDDEEGLVMCVTKFTF